MPTALAKPGPETNDAKGIAFAGNWPDQRVAINRIGDRTIHHLFDANFRQGGHAGNCPF